MSKVSVILSVLNGEKFIQEAVDSILRQTFPFFELIIINDGSTDRTAEILNQYNDPRIRIINNSENLGLIASLNIGLGAAKGEFIARLDADDVAEPDRLKKQVDFLNSNPNIGILGSNSTLIDNEGNVIASPSNITLSPNLIHWQLFYGCPLSHPTVMFRREIYDQYGGFNPAYPHAEDYEYWLRINPIVEFANLPDPLVRIRIHSKNISRIYSKEQNHNSNLAAQKAISTLIDRDISFEQVRDLRNHHYIVTADQAFSAAELLTQIYLIFMSRYRTSKNEMHLIQADILDRTIEFLIICLKNQPGKSFHIWRNLTRINLTLVFRSGVLLLSRGASSLRLRFS